MVVDEPTDVIEAETFAIEAETDAIDEVTAAIDDPTDLIDEVTAAIDDPPDVIEADTDAIEAETDAIDEVTDGFEWGDFEGFKEEISVLFRSVGVLSCCLSIGLEREVFYSTTSPPFTQGYAVRLVGKRNGS